MLKNITASGLLKPWIMAGVALPLLSSCTTFESIYAYTKSSLPVPSAVVFAEPIQPIFVSLEENQRIWRESTAKATAPSEKDMTPAQELEQTTAAIVAAQGGIGLKIDTTFASASRIVPFSYSKSGLDPATAKIIREVANLAKTAERVYVRGDRKSVV